MYMVRHYDITQKCQVIFNPYLLKSRQNLRKYFCIREETAITKTREGYKPDIVRKVEMFEPRHATLLLHLIIYVNHLILGWPIRPLAGVWGRSGFFNPSLRICQSRYINPHVKDVWATGDLAPVIKLYNPTPTPSLSPLPIIY